MLLSEKDAATVGGTNGADASPTASDQQSDSSPGPNKCQAFDLFNIVVSYKKLEMYLEPVKDTWEGIKYLISWQMPLCSLLTCFAVNIMLLTLNEVAWFTAGSLFIAVPALLGYLQEISQENLSEQARTRRKYHSVRTEDLQKVKISRQEAVAEFKSFMIQLDGLLSMFCSSFETVYKVLYWENSTVSFQFYGVLLGSVCILYLLPLSSVLAILTSTLFFWNAEFYRVLTEYMTAHRRTSSASVTEATPDMPDSGISGGEGGAISERTPTPTSTEDLSPGSVEEAEEAEPDEEFKDAIEEDDDNISQGTVEYELGLQDNGFMTKNEVIRNKVSKLTEKLRKRYPANSIATCTGCTATFSVLKKRRICSNCGNSFCSRCCSFKVPKSFMGATAPDAQRETVFVCAPCNQSLSKKE